MAIPCGDCDEMDCNACDYQSLMDKEEKYAWHDLRRNPEDLPEEKEMVLVCYKFWDSHNSHKVAWFHRSQYDTCFYPDGNSRIDMSMVIAWLSIIPEVMTMANKDCQRRNKNRISQANKRDGIEYAGLKQGCSQKYRAMIARDNYGARKNDNERRPARDTELSEDIQEDG